MGQISDIQQTTRWTCGLLHVLAATVLTAGLTACSGGSSGSNTASFGAGPIDTPDDRLLCEYDPNCNKDPNTAAQPTVSAQVLLKKVATLDMDKLYEFLRKVSNNQAVSVGGQRIGNVNDLLKRYRDHFFKIRRHFNRVSDFWVYMRFNPTSVSPTDFKNSLRDTANFVVNFGAGALTNRPPLPGGKKVSKEESRNKGRSCVVATPILLNGCTNMKNQAACNDLTAAMICVVHYMFKSKQPAGQEQEEGFQDASSDKSQGGADGGGDGGDEG